MGIKNRLEKFYIKEGVARLDNCASNVSNWLVIFAGNITSQSETFEAQLPNLATTLVNIDLF